MKNKLILVVTAFVFLFFLFFFLEEKDENLTEVNFWKTNWKTALYSPPKETWCGEKEPGFAENPLLFRLFERGWKKPPVFSVSQEDPATKTLITYEGNFNVKNTFSDLSVLKTKFIEKSTESVLESYCLKEDAPNLNLSEDLSDVSFVPKEGKIIYFGKKIASDSSRVSARVEEEILSPYSYLADKFRTKSVAFRERQYIQFSGGYLTSLEFSGQGMKIRAENRAKKNQYDTYVNQWSRPTQERIVLSPDVGNNWETQSKNLRADLYPDDESGPGFAFAKTSTESEPEAVFVAEHSTGYRWKVKFYPKAEWNGQIYRPVLRELSPYFEESPSFVKEETFQNFIQATLGVKNASRFERPNQKIQ